MYHSQVGFIPKMQGFFNIHNSINGIHHINKPDKSHMIISVVAEKKFWQNWTLIYDKKKKQQQNKALRKMDIEGNYLNIIKVIYNKPTANTILNGENGSMSFKIRNKTTLPIIIIQDNFRSPRYDSQRRKRNKTNTTWKRSKLFTVCRWHDTICKKS